MDRNGGVMSQLLDSKEEKARFNVVSSSWQENLNYRDGYKAMIWFVKLQTMGIVALICIMYYFIATHENKDRYFAETVEGQVMQMASLAYPNMGREALADWVSQAAVEIMTFGFNDLDERFDISKNNFTPKGWEAFRKAAIDSKLIENVTNNQQIVTAAPASVPVLMSEGLVMDKYTWTFEMDIMITFRSGSAKQNGVRHLRVVMERTPTAQNPVGVGISEWYMY